MTKAEQPTDFIYDKANTPSEWDSCDFALVRVTDPWLNLLEERTDLLEPFEDRDDFYSLEFWDSPDGYFTDTYGDENDEPYTKLLGDGDPDWCFAELSPDEMELFSKPESRLATHQLVVTKGGHAYFTALGKHTDERYFTSSFPIRELIELYRAPECRSQGR